MKQAYILTYQNDESNKKCTVIENTIRSFGGESIHLQETVWLLKTDFTIREIHDSLLLATTKGTRLFISKIEPCFDGNLAPYSTHEINRVIFER